VESWFIGAALIGLALAVLPSAAFADTFYTVAPGDSLWKISVNNGISVEKLKTINSLNSTIIFPGQTLIISINSQTTPPDEVSRGTSRVEIIIDYARSLIGSPYLFGGQSPKGFDCSGYMRYVFNNFGVDLPRTAEEQYNKGREVSEKDARPGDIVAFVTGDVITHTGIYLGGGKFISSTSSHGVMIDSVHGYYWGEHFHGFCRIIP